MSYRVTSNDNGVDVDISVQQTVPGTAASPQPAAPVVQPPPQAARPAPAPGGGSIAPAVQPQAWTDDTGIHRIAPDGTRTDLTPPLIGFASQHDWQQESIQHQDQTPFVLNVNGQFQGIVWVANVFPPLTMPSPPPLDNSLPQGNGGTDPHQVALDILAHIPLPPVKVRMNPGLGLVGMTSWYWVDGYDGRDISQSRTVTIPPPAPGLPPTSFTVTVRIWPTSYDWDFGDSTTITSHSLGEPYPQQSDIQHNYGFSSLLFPSGFPVRLTIHFAAEYRVNGGGAQALPAIHHTYESDYRVQELQPVLAQH